MATGGHLTLAELPAADHYWPLTQKPLVPVAIDNLLI